MSEKQGTSVRKASERLGKEVMVGVPKSEGSVWITSRVRDRLST